MFLVCLKVMNFGGELGILIFQTQNIMEWSLKQSDMTPDLMILAGLVTSIQSRSDEDRWSTLVGSFIICVRLMLLSRFLSFVQEWLGQCLLKSPNSMSSFCLSKELMVDRIQFMESTGADGGL